VGDLAVVGKIGPEFPALIAGAGGRASWSFLEFFTVNIRNPNTRTAYGRAAGAFLRWCEGQGITTLAGVLPVHVAAYVEQLQGRLAAPTVKQHLACIRMLFDWLVTGQVVPSNPAHFGAGAALCQPGRPVSRRSRVRKNGDPGRDQSRTHEPHWFGVREARLRLNLEPGPHQATQERE
jgi:hypothetical protein